MLAQEIIRRKRDGHTLERAHIDAFVKGLVDHGWSDAQVAAMAMASYLKGLTHDETLDLTDAMLHSGARLQWRPALDGPFVDKHSTGGVGDKVSIMLAPILAACGAKVPMVSGRGLGHTGGTLDKLESIPGYRTTLSRAEMEATLRSAGCTIVGASADVAPADRRLYSIRDVTATVESIPLICASILSKKLAAGLDALVLDVKVGTGAFAPDAAFARELAEVLVDVARRMNLAASAWITDMSQVLGRTCGNAVEMVEAVRFLQGRDVDARLALVTRTLSAELLVMAGIDANAEAAGTRVDRALASGSALEHFARMVAAHGGGTDFMEHAEQRLPMAPVQRPVVAARAGWVQSVAVRDIGIACIELGGGRRKSGDAIDPRVGFTQVAAPGERVEAGGTLALVHAANEADAVRVCGVLASAFVVADEAREPPPILVARVGGKA